MNKVLTAFFAILCQVSFSQKIYRSFQFDKFIAKSSIEWAADASDTFNLSNSNLNITLLNRLKNDEIKASVAEVTKKNTAYHLRYSSFNEIFSSYYFPHSYPLYDSLGRVIEEDRTIPEVDPLKFKYTEITQVLYIEKGVLKSYVPMVTPTLSLYLSTGKYIGETFYFTTAFNLKYNYKPRKRDKIVFLQQTKKELKFSDSKNNLKEMYGANLMETLWPSVVSGKIKLYNVASGKEVSLTSFNMPQEHNALVSSPVYDSVNVVFKYETVIKSAKPTDFTAAVLVQDWYYNESRNIVFNKIKEMHLYMNNAEPETNSPPAPVLKLVFN